MLHVDVIMHVRIIMCSPRGCILLSRGLVLKCLHFHCYAVHDQHSSSLDLYLAAISEKMHRTVINNTIMFKTLRFVCIHILFIIKSKGKDRDVCMSYSNTWMMGTYLTRGIAYLYRKSAAGIAQGSQKTTVLGYCL